MAGVLSALGIGLADTTAMREQSVEAPLEPAHWSDWPRSRDVAGERPRRARSCATRASRPSAIRVTRRAQLRYDGTDTARAGRAGRPGADDRRRSRPATGATYSFLMDRPLIVEAVSVEATGLTEQPRPVPRSAIRRGRAGRRTDTVPALHRRTLAARRRCTSGSGCGPATSVTGPAIIAEANATTVVDRAGRPR